MRTAVGFFNVACVGLLLRLATIPAYATPQLDHGTSITGAIAYQDDSDPNQFFYLPTVSTAALGPNLQDFSVAYYGYGPEHPVQTSDNQILSAAGALLGATFKIDISDDTRTKLLAQITKDFPGTNPRLLPLQLRHPKIKSLLLADTIGHFGTVEQNLPDGFQIGPVVAFTAGANNSLFAQVLANEKPNGHIVSNPLFSLNIDAGAEFVGAPWTSIIHCDLNQVWHDVRTSVNASVSWGWFNLSNAQWNSIVQNLQKGNECTFDMKEGSLDTAVYGRQLQEAAKEIFEFINAKSVEGEGYFRFEPNPQAPQPGGGGGGGIFGWSVSVNVSRSEASLEQHFTMDRKLSFTGHVEVPISMGSVLSVNCSGSTDPNFTDLGDTTEACITQKKIDTFKARSDVEKAAKLKEKQKWQDAFFAGKCTYDQMNQAWSYIDHNDISSAFVKRSPTTAKYAAQATSIPSNLKVTKLTAYITDPKKLKRSRLTPISRQALAANFYYFSRVPSALLDELIRQAPHVPNHIEGPRIHKL